MERREYEGMAKKICEEEMKKYSSWIIKDNNQLELGLHTLGINMEELGIDLNSKRAEEMIKAYALGFEMARKQAVYEHLTSPQTRKYLREALSHK